MTNGGSIPALSTLYYNNRLQPCRITVNTNGTWPSSCTDGNTGNVMDFTYDFSLGWADNGNVFRIANNRSGAAARSINYTYDSLNRIAGAYSDGNLWGESYQIDAWGNLTGIGAFMGRPQGENLNLGATLNNQLTGLCTTNCYDAAGNVTNNGAYTYDVEGHLISAAGVTYGYDGDGRRVMKSSGSPVSPYELYWYGTGSDPLAETDQNGNLTNEYIFFNGTRIARRDPSGNIFYYFADQLGTSRTIVQSGQTNACYETDFYPFGREISPITNTCPQAYKFTGKERDSESGLDNFGARYDSSQYGRFMSADEPFAGWDQHEPQSFNLYSYVENNPLNHVDPDGHDVQICVQDSSDEKKQTCTTVSEQKYQQLYNAQNGQQGINLPGGNFPTGNITCGGQTCGTARYFEPGMEDQTANLIGLAEGARGVLGLARAAYESIAGLFAKGAAEEGGVVIGKQTLLDTPGTLRPGERTLDLAEDMGSPKANWAQNSGKLREAMSEGQPIRDASAGGSNTGFLRAERNLLENHGWSLKGDHWYPPNR